MRRFTPRIGGLAAIVIVTGISIISAQAHAEGALAVGSNGRYGLSYGYDGRRGAAERALQECGRGCEIVTFYEGSCTAYASAEDGAYGWATRAERGRAERAAIENCEREGGRYCRVRIWGCDG